MAVLGYSSPPARPFLAYRNVKYPNRAPRGPSVIFPIVFQVFERRNRTCQEEPRRGQTARAIFHSLPKLRRDSLLHFIGGRIRDQLRQRYVPRGVVYPVVFLDGGNVSFVHSRYSG